MSAGDILEFVTVLISMPLAAAWLFFCAVVTLYVYFDAEARFKNWFIAAGLTIAVTFYYWPISLFAYIMCMEMLDRNRIKSRTA